MAKRDSATVGETPKAGSALTSAAARTAKPAVTTAVKAAKKAPAKKAPAKKAPAKKAPAKKAPAKKAPAKAPVKKAPAKKAPAKKAPAKAPVKKAPAKQAPAKQAQAKGAPAKKTTAPAQVPAKKAAVKRSSRMVVRADENPWTAKELRAVRTELEADLERLHDEIAEAEEGLADLLRDSGDGAGDDQADAGTKTFEREHEMSLANNARDVIEQTERALRRLDDRTYGVCEACGNPIGKARLQVFPRATLCLTCKQKEERR